MEKITYKGQEYEVHENENYYRGHFDPFNTPDEMYVKLTKVKPTPTLKDIFKHLVSGGEVVFKDDLSYYFNTLGDLVFSRKNEEVLIAVIHPFFSAAAMGKVEDAERNAFYAGWNRRLDFSTKEFNVLNIAKAVGEQFDRWKEEKKA